MQLPESNREAFSPDEFAKRNSIGRTTVFAEIKAGRLNARKVGSRTVITREAERAWQKSLPHAGPTATASIEVT
jgi:hypothetical protein